jgi:hypothetical protein
MSGTLGEYNPLDYTNLTRNCVEQLMRRGPFDLPLGRGFPGAGVYALFYRGDAKIYAKIRSPDATWPIYVGKAVPPGARKGGAASSGAHALHDRLTEHTKSIEAATNLAIADFTCRYLVVTPLWITMAERFLVEHFKPVWNLCIEGFGNHDPGSGRHQGEIAWWDTLHSGRAWAKKLRQTRRVEDAKSHLSTFFKTYEKRPLDEVLAPQPSDADLPEAAASPDTDEA